MSDADGVQLSRRDRIEAILRVSFPGADADAIHAAATLILQLITEIRR